MKSPPRLRLRCPSSDPASTNKAARPGGSENLSPPAHEDAGVLAFVAAGALIVDLRDLTGGHAGAGFRVDLGDHPAPGGKLDVASRKVTVLVLPSNSKLTPPAQPIVCKCVSPRRAHLFLIPVVNPVMHRHL